MSLSLDSEGAEDKVNCLFVLDNFAAFTQTHIGMGHMNFRS